MTYSSNFVYTTINGVFQPSATVLETWKVGFKIPLSSAPSGAQLAAYLAAIETPISTFHSFGNVKAGITAKFTFLTAAHIGTDGKYTGGGAQTTTVRTLATPVAGSGTTQTPFSQAVVLSLRTQFARGLASHGRMYWPFTGQVMSADGLMATTQAQSIADSAKTMLDAINGAAAAQLSTTNKVSIMSNVGSGQLAPVIKVLVGVKADRQERREKSQLENYQTSVLASTLNISDDLAELAVDQLPGGIGVRPRQR